VQIVVGIGGNLGDELRIFRHAREGLAAVGRVVGCSRLYRTAAVGPPQPEYSNAALLLATEEPPIALLERCQELEAAAGRVRERERRWGPRPLDLDLLIARSLVHRGPRLMLPHLHLDERAFALLPAAELVPDWLHPLLGRRISELARVTADGEPHSVRCLGLW
jgi:2-amino-4-hydroxy-6-hydroxymethyldihydropteridine diphosphokinase